MISDEQRAEIRRLFYAEHWKVGTIAASLGVHPDTVKRAIEVDRFRIAAGRPRPTKADPFLPFIRETLERYPRLRSTRLCEMLRGRGYTGSAVQLRRAVRRLRPGPHAGRVPAAARHAGRAGASRLGLLRNDRPGADEASAVVLRDGAVVVAGDPRTLHARPDAGELRARSRRGVCVLPGRCREPCSTTT